MAWDPIGASLMGPEGPPGSDADVTDHENASNPHPQYATASDLSSGLAGKADDVHTHDISDVDGLQAELDLKENRKRLISGAPPSSYTLDADENQAIDFVLDGDLTLNVPTGGFNHLSVQVVMYAEDADREVTFASGFERLDGIESSYTIPEGKYLRASLRRTDPPNSIFPAAWIIEAVGVTQ